MGIEAIGASIGSVASDIGKGASNAGSAIGIGTGVGVSLGGIGRGLGEVSIGMGSVISAGPVRGFGSLASFGPELKAPSLPFVNEGPVKGGLDMFKPIGQINFNNQAQARPQPTGIEIPEVFQKAFSDVDLDPSTKPTGHQFNILDEATKLTEAAWSKPLNPDTIQTTKVLESDSQAGIKPEVAQSWVVNALTPVFLPGYVPLAVPALEPITKTKSILATQVATQSQSEVKVAFAPAVQAPVVEDQQIEEFVEKIVAVKNEEDNVEEKNSEASEETKIQRVVDEPAANKRIDEIIAAATAVQEEDGIIEGEKIVKKLPSQNKKNRSGELNIVDPEGRLLDGSLRATFKKITSSKFTSLVDVIKRAPKIVAENIPVTRGEGQLVTNEDVAKVYEQYKGKVPPAQEVIKRVVKMLRQIKIVKRVEQPAQIMPIHEEVIERNEGTPNSELAAALLVPYTI